MFGAFGKTTVAAMDGFFVCVTICSGLPIHAFHREKVYTARWGNDVVELPAPPLRRGVELAAGHTHARTYARNVSANQTAYTDSCIGAWLVHMQVTYTG